MIDEHRATILVVDDTPENLEIMIGLLADRYQVKVASDGDTALRLAAEHRPDLILLDIMMPGLDGFAVLRRLLAGSDTAGIPVIFLTARDGEADEEEGIRSGAVDYLTKPIRPAILRARVDAHVRAGQAQALLRRRNDLLEENLRLRQQVERVTHHDLRTPLTVLLNSPDLIAAVGPVTGAQQEVCQRMRRAAGQMQQLVAQSLDLLKLERGKQEPTVQPVDLAEVLAQVIEDCRPDGSGPDICCEPVPVGLRISGDSGFCYALLVNLVKNAVEASTAQEQVRIAVVDADPVVISISNPKPIPLALRDRFFEPLLTHGKAGGTGLGTYAARLYADAMQGGVSFTSSDSSGTIVQVTLPRA